MVRIELLIQCVFYLLVSSLSTSVCIEQNETCHINSETSNRVHGLNEAHEFMFEHNSSTMIVYLNENDSVEETRNYIYKYYLDTFNLYYSLYDNIRDEYFWHSGCKLRWPVGWYLAHAASFYVNKLRMNNYITNRGINDELYNEYDYLFAQGTDEMDWNDFVTQYPISYWPVVENVKMYVQNVKEIISDIILTAPLNSLPINKSMPIWWAVLMGIEHERIHLETSAMLIRQLPLHKCKDTINEIWSHEYPLSDNDINNIPPDNELISVKGETITYGRDADLLANNKNDFFGWDAEYGQYTVNVTDFNASKYMVSNYEYYEFYVHDGYLIKEYWSDDGWQWVQQTNTKHPKFWIINNNKTNKTNIKLRNLFSEIDMFYAWNRPVITNHYEADAFIKWKSMKLNKNLRLITEDEWYLLRTSPNNNKNIRELADDNSNVFFPANTNFHYFTTEAPINIFRFGANDENQSFYDIIGNVQHHTISQYHPFNNYEIDPLYVDFSSPFFNDSYFLMKGGSYLSSGNMAMIYNRCQWFRSHYFQASGIRYVESNRMDIEIINNDKKTTNQYFKHSDESDELCYECIHFQYSNNNYRRIVSNVISEYINKITNNILDIGCSVGAVTYELAKIQQCENIIGIDDRARFIGIANQIQQNKKLEYFMKNDYGQNKYHFVTLNGLGSNINNVTNKIRFVHSHNLNNLFCDECVRNPSKYDLIIGENMFERYYEKLLNNNYKLSDILNRNGTIILFEDYKWNKNDEINITNEMNNILGNKLTLINEFNTKPIIRQDYESSRIHKQYSLHCTIWRYT